LKCISRSTSNLLLINALVPLFFGCVVDTVTEDFVGGLSRFYYTGAC